MEERALLKQKLPPDLNAPGLAREALADLPSDLAADQADLRIMVSELVTNSVRHGDLAPADRIELAIFQTGPGIRVEVRDPGHGYESASIAVRTIPERRRRDEPLVDRGFGLMVIAALADRFGARWDEGTVMWFEMDGDRTPEAPIAGRQPH